MIVRFEAAGTWLIGRSEAEEREVCFLWGSDDGDFPLSKKCRVQTLGVELDILVVLEW